MRFHIDERIEGLVAAGRPRADAEREIMERFGNYDRYRDETRTIDEDMLRQRRWIDIRETIRRSLALGARMLFRTRSFSTLAIITLSLGIGATTAIFSVLRGVVLRPLPYAQPEQLVAIKHPANVPGSGDSRWGLSPAGYFHFRKTARFIDDMGAFSMQEATLLTDGEANRVRAVTVTASLVSTLQLRTIMGRGLLPTDDVPDAEPVVVLSYEAWTNRFGRAPDVVGRMLDLNGYPARVVGIMQPRTMLPWIDLGGAANSGGAMSAPELWAALRLNPSAQPVNAHWLQVVARMKHGVSIDALRADLADQVRRFPELYPTAYTSAFLEDYRFTVAATPLQDDAVGSMARLMWLLLGAVSVVFVIAATNVANLFLVRAEVRRRETSVRVALGADRAQLAMHYLSESLLLSTVAAGIGIGLARAGVWALTTLAPDGLARFADVRVDAVSIAVALGLATLSGVVFGSFPIRRGAVDIMAIRDGGRGTTISRARRRIREAFVVAQVSLALVLLAAAGLMVRSMSRLAEVQPGFDARGTISMELPLSRARYRTYDDVAAFTRALLEQVRGIPGVSVAGIGSGVPLIGMGGCAVAFAEGQVTDANAEPPCVGNAMVSEGFLEALGVQVRGRGMSWGDIDALNGSVVVSRELAQRFWPGQDPIGKGIRPNGHAPPYYRVVGVIEGLRAVGLERPPVEIVLYPLKPIPGAQLWQPLNTPTLVIRTDIADPTAIVPQVRRVLASLDRQVPLTGIRTMEAIVRDSIARTRFIMLLLGVAAGMAMLLSAVGLYGVISYLVTQRRSEIGVRMALGARVSQVSGQVIRESLQLALAGVVIGLLGAFVVNRLLSVFLFETRPYDPLTLTLTSLSLIAVATLASALPARRAARVAPIEVLRDG